jgi:hypothetical protein
MKTVSAMLYLDCVLYISLQILSAPLWTWHLVHRLSREHCGEASVLHGPDGLHLRRQGVVLVWGPQQVERPDHWKENVMRSYSADENMYFCLPLQEVPSHTIWNVCHLRCKAVQTHIAGV